MAPGHKFASHVSLDAGAPARMPAQAAYDHDAGDEAAADRLSGFIVAWCSLPPKTQRVVSLRLLHVCGHSRHTYVAIGRALRIFPQDAEARLNRALRDMPVLREAFALKEAKKLRRRPLRRNAGTEARGNCVASGALLADESKGETK